MAIRRDSVIRCASMLLLAALWLATPAAGQSASPADQQWTFAVRLVQQAENDLAEGALDDFLRDFPNDARTDDAHYYLAVLAERRGELDAAVKHLAQVAQPVYITASSVKLLLGQVRLRQGDAEAAVGVLEQVQPAGLPDDATRASWHYLLGACYRRLDNPTAAAARFDKAGEADSPVKGRALLELGKARLMLDRPNPAAEAFQEVIRAGGVDADAVAEARSLAADLAYRRGQYERAADLYDQVVAHHPSSRYFGDAQVGLLRALHAAGRDDQVIQRYADLAGLLPAEAIGEALYLKASAQTQLRRYEQALVTLDQYTRRTERHHRLRDQAVELGGLCLYHLDAGRFVDWYDQHQPDSRRIRYLRALVAADREQPRRAIDLLDALVEPADGGYAGDALLQRAKLHRRLGQTRQAADDLALYARRYRDSPRAATARRRAIDLAFDAEQFQRVLSLSEGLDSDPPLLLQQALAHLKLDQPDPAKARLDELLATEPGDRLAALGRFYRGMVLASRAAKPQDDRGAIDDLNAAIDGPLPDAQRTAALTTLARLHRRAGRDDAALAMYQRLGEADNHRTIDPTTALWVGQGLVEAGQAQAALDWLERAIDADSLDPSRRAKAMYYHARALFQLQRYADAVEAYRRTIAFTQPQAYGYQSRLGLAQAFAAQGEVDAAQEEYNGLVSAPGSRVAATALYESAMLHLDEAHRHERSGMAPAAAEHRTEAQRRLHRLVILYDLRALDPLPWQGRLMLGRMDLAAGRIDKAAERFQAVADGAADPAWRRIAQAERQALDSPNAAQAALQQIAREHADTPAGRYAARRAEQGVTP